MSIESLIIRFIKKIKSYLYIFKKNKILKNLKKSNTNQLNNFYKKVYSQNGEDGVIEKIFEEIGFKSKISLETGANWKECNSRYLIEKYGFNGYLIDCLFKENIEDKNATFIKEWITRENINQIISKYVCGEIDFLSIDVDGVDLHILNEIDVINPRLICIEYCASIGKDISVTVPYKSNFDRHTEHSSGMYCNASLLAYINLLKNKDYKFIGTVYGLNAFFVSKNCKLRNLKELSCNEGFEPHYERTFIRGISEQEQYNTIKDMKWIEVGKDGNFNN